MKKNTENGNTNDAIKYSALGINFAVAPAVGFALGYFIDHWFGTGNLFKWILSISGFLAAILEVARAARKYARQSETASSVADGQDNPQKHADTPDARSNAPDAWTNAPDAWSEGAERKDDRDEGKDD